MTQQLTELREENAKALAYLELANREKEKAKEQEHEHQHTISTLQQQSDENNQKYLSLKREYVREEANGRGEGEKTPLSVADQFHSFFISTCLAIKLNLSRINRPVNVPVEELWELAQEQDVTIEQFPKFITAEIRKRYEASCK